MSSELISVIVPVYNTGLYLSRCVNSILAQDYREIEILLIDDGSTDQETALLCDTLAKNNKSVLAFHKQNGGSAGARNFGIKQAHGNYIGFVDSDDVIEPNMYSSLLRDIHEHGVRIALGNIATEQNGRLIDKREQLPSGEYNNTQLLHYFFLGHWHSTCTNLYDRTLFNIVQFPDGEVNEDYMLNYSLFKDQKKVYFNNTVFYHYVRREGSNTSSPVSLAFLDWLKHTSIVREEFSSHEQLVDEADYQYIYSNIVLGNKCLLTLSRCKSEDANQLYSIVTNNLKREKKRLFHNRFLPLRYRTFGLALSFTPSLYKSVVIFILHIIKRNG